MNAFAHLLLLLLFAHALCDYPLQGEFLSRAKNARSPIPGIDWSIALFMHAMIHAGAVYLITGRMLWAFVQLATHMIIDHAKCINALSFRQDQLLHVAVMIWIAAMVAYG